MSVAIVPGANVPAPDTGAAPAKRTGAEMIWEVLEQEGIEVVFGYPGGAIMPAYDALTKYKVRHVLVRHEQGAAHMADGYARASGRVGVAIATSGPGATNLVTGIATAMMDSDSPASASRVRCPRRRCIGSDALPGNRHHPASRCPSPSTTTW